MRLGFVAPHDAVVAVFRDAGHDVFVLTTADAAPPDESVERMKSPPTPSPGEYVEWAMRRGLRAAFFFGDRNFAEIAALRGRGVVTIGGFRWDGFADEDSGPAGGAFDCVYALHEAQVRRFAAMGILAPRVRWCAPPDLATTKWEAKAPYAPVGFLCDVAAPELADVVAKAFAKEGGARVVATNVVGREADANVSWRRRPASRAEAVALLRAADVRLFLGRGDISAFAAADAIGTGLPIVCPNAEPWNEHVRDGLTGLLVKCSTKSRKGWAPDVELGARDLAAAVRRLSDRRVVEAMTANTRRLLDFDYDWSRTKDDLLRLLDRTLAARR